jgi:iron complex transport system substrate-binding protein
MKRTGSPLALLLLAFVLLASACGSSSDDASTGAATTVPAEQASSGQAATRSVDHTMGTTEVPVEPKRIVGLDYDVLDAMTALGFEPVGATESFAGFGIPEYLRDRLGGIELVGTIEEPNLEAIAALEPDLIISSKVRHEQIYEELSQIAPTVFAENVGSTWKQNVPVYGDAVGKREESEQLLADYEARGAEVGERIAGQFGAAPTISVVRFLPDETRIYTKDNFIGSILEDVGLPRPEPQDVEEFALYPSPEQIGLMAGDIIFFTHFGPPEETTAPQVTSDPLWQNLEAVQEGRAYNVPEDHWIVGIGVQAANLVLDDFEEIIVEQG